MKIKLKKQRAKNQIQSDRILNQNLCTICFVNESNVVIMSCGHSEICMTCAKDI